MSIDCDEYLREQAEAMALLDGMRTALADASSYTSRYVTLREQVQNGLLTEREYSLIEEGRTI